MNDLWVRSTISNHFHPDNGLLSVPCHNTRGSSLKQVPWAERSVVAMEPVLAELLDRWFIKEGKIVVHLSEGILDRNIYTVLRREVPEGRHGVLRGSLDTPSVQLKNGYV